MLYGIDFSSGIRTSFLITSLIALVKLSKLFNDFFHSEKSSGAVLMICTLVSLVIANSGWSPAYTAFWETNLASHSLTHWVNDGLMAIFFLLVGLELEREIYIGKLSTITHAALPVVSALGGMIVPAAIHLALNFGTGTQRGAGIPMATDIAFAIVILSTLGNKVPNSLKVFLTALAVIDDLGAIIVIAIFYTSSVDWTYLGLASGVFVVLLALNRLRVHNLIPYLIGGVAMWYFMLHSGIHATLAGVLLAFAIPFGNGDERSTSYVLQRYLHGPVAFIVLPVFALANTAFSLPSDWVHALVEVNSLGIFLGLFIGKPLGIALFSYLFSVLRITEILQT